MGQAPKEGRRETGHWAGGLGRTGSGGGRTEKGAKSGGQAAWGLRVEQGPGPLTCLGCSGAESAVATAYKQREGEAALSAVGRRGRWAGWEGWLARPGSRLGGPRWALPPGPAAGGEGRKALIGMGPGRLLTSKEVKLRQQLHLSPHVQLAMAEGGVGSWPEHLEGLCGSSDPGMGAPKGQALPSGQPPFSWILPACP